ncbi:hypothetical protein Ais01nite_47810 [Asanoa ishikariensis]|uniref:Uncharacterized protein n=1 Tax=Asanoa ishikariensis TaxID=137265 RepID=A0A1H3RWD0_9ACTN|nr:hypothetical protein [Asanoa ishikariensis]GIF66746.1 hypothetical protein Ais01nite_47810 [Asanoa ishikariensis]SDZ30044.1 hypothetical protein SAMN05421684_4304 [Asanoa ishikariensis]
MLSPLHVLRAALARYRPRRMFWLGRPLRATIARDADGSCVLRIAYTQGVDWVALPATRDPSGPPDDDQLAAVAVALADRSLRPTEPWAIDTNAELCTSLVATRWPGATGTTEG